MNNQHLVYYLSLARILLCFSLFLMSCFITYHIPLIQYYILCIINQILLRVLAVQVHDTGGFAAASIDTLVGGKPGVYIAVFAMFHCSHLRHTLCHMYTYIRRRT